MALRRSARAIFRLVQTASILRSKLGAGLVFAQSHLAASSLVHLSARWSAVPTRNLKSK